jgi:hypothetical protein
VPETFVMSTAESEPARASLEPDPVRRDSILSRDPAEQKAALWRRVRNLEFQRDMDNVRIARLEGEIAEVEGRRPGRLSVGG